MIARNVAGMSFIFILLVVFRPVPVYRKSRSSTLSAQALIKEISFVIITAQLLIPFPSIHSHRFCISSGCLCLLGFFCSKLSTMLILLYGVRFLFDSSNPLHGINLQCFPIELVSDISYCLSLPHCFVSYLLYSLSMFVCSFLANGYFIHEWLEKHRRVLTESFILVGDVLMVLCL